jgi:hypothetical protein
MTGNRLEMRGISLAFSGFQALAMWLSPCGADRYMR